MADNAFTYDPNTMDTIEPLAKRPRLSLPSDPSEELEGVEGEEEEQEEEVSDDWDLQTARAQNDMKLKSIFEDIFAKYSQDFTEVGDEIDLETGDIIVDNGHLLGLEEEGAGNPSQPWHSDHGEDGEEDIEDGNDEDPAGLQNQADAVVFEDNPSNDPFGPSKPNSTDQTVDEEKSNSRDSALTSTSDNPKARPNPVPQQQLDLKPPPDVLGPTDPVWKVPELPQPFSTPKTQTRFAKAPVTPRLPKLDRGSSPPGSKSLWSLPRQRRPRTERKPRASPSKTRPRAKRKYHSSPVAYEALDWSFADVPEGDESDDPLQEHQPSPTPSKTSNIRRKRMRITTKEDFRLENRINLNQKLSTSAEPGPQDQSATSTHLDAGHSHVEQGDAQATVANTFDLQCDLPAHSTATHGAAPASGVGTGADADAGPGPGPVSASTSASAPTLPSVGFISPTSRIKMTPDETKLILRMRYVEHKRWKQILPFLPNRTISSLHQWNSRHWLGLRANPPPVQAPWSLSELKTLDRVQNQPFLTWDDMIMYLPNRSRDEIEFELMRRWVGDEVWNQGRRNILPPSNNNDHRLDGQGDRSQDQNNGPENKVYDHTPSQTPVKKHIPKPPNTPSAGQGSTVYLLSDGEDQNDDEDKDAMDTLSDHAEDHKQEINSEPQLPDMHIFRAGARPVQFAGTNWKRPKSSDLKEVIELDD